MNWPNQKSFIPGISVPALMLICSVIFCSVLAVSAQEQTPQLAPLNPDFVQNTLNEAYKTEAITTEGHTLGYFPSPVNLPQMTGQIVFQIKTNAFPSSYDLRTTGKLTPVKNQGSCGSCWAFGTMGSIESGLLPAETWDFSENNLKNTIGFDRGHCDGGNANMSMAYLARWGGPVKEADDPYNAYSNVSPSGLTIQKHVQEALIIPARASSSDNDSIKQAVMTYGALQTAMYWSDLSYNFANKAYYYNAGTNVNHAVNIVGWDDTYSKSNFTTAPPGDGAFIIRNSWGTSWGMSGYFYISYYDTAMGKYNNVFNGAQNAINYKSIYQYDPLGWVGNLGYTGSNAAWLANVFTAAANEQVSAISFYTSSPNSPYEIYVYTNAVSGPTSGSIAGSATGTIAFAGYHTVALTSPISITVGQKFSIVVKLTTPGFNYPIPLEYPVSSYSSQATAGAGQSFISDDATSWTDLTTAYANANVCIKAFTSLGTAVPDTSITSNPANPNNSTSASFSFSSTVGSSTFQCQMDTGGYSGCTTPKSYAGLTAGSHTFSVKATDTAGNTDATPASYTWMIDLTAPDTSMTAQPVNPSNATSASFSFSGSDAESGLASFGCQLDNGGYSSCSSPKAYGSLGQGGHTFEVRAVDRAGNTDATPANYTWTIDLTAPDTSITAKPVNPSNSTSASFSFSSTEGSSTFQCQMDMGGYSACTTPKSYTGLTEGSHTFSVKATDAAGNTDATPASYTWTIDITAPDLSISTLSDGAWTNNLTLNISGTATDSVGMNTLMINGVSAALNSDNTFSHAVILLLGANVITTVAKDLAGNETTDIRTINYDSAGPVLDITAPADNSKTKAAGVTVSGTVDETSTVTASLNGDLPVPAIMIGNSFSYDIIFRYGLNTIELAATDRAGNTTTGKRTVTFDNQNPSLSITDPAQDIATDASPMAITGTVTDLTIPTVTMTVDGGPAQTLTATNGIFNASVTFTTEKTYVIVVTATDEAGNISTVTRNIIYDMGGPLTTASPAGGTFSTPQHVILSCDDRIGTGGSGCASTLYCLGSGCIPLTDYTGEIVISGSTDLRFFSIDSAGNAESVRTVTFTLTTYPLTVNTLSFSAAAYTVSESRRTVTITVRRTGSITGSVGVTYATSNGTATADTPQGNINSDYTAKTGTLSWASGNIANKTFTVSITNDTRDEENETFTVSLSNPTGGAILGTPNSATVTITDNDSPPKVQFSVASSSGSEATTPAAIIVKLSAASGLPVTVNYATANGTATAGTPQGSVNSDYTTTSGTLTFNSGVTSQTINVPIINDPNYEANETFTVRLTSPVNATLGKKITHTHTITNDDPVLMIQSR